MGVDPTIDPGVGWAAPEPADPYRGVHPARRRSAPIVTLLLWLILLVISWPLALIALLVYPLAWLLVLPFRVVGITVSGVLESLRAVVTLPARLLRGGHRR